MCSPFRATCCMAPKVTPAHDRPRRAFAVMLGGPNLRYHAPKGKAFPVPAKVQGIKFDDIPHGAPIGNHQDAFPALLANAVQARSLSAPRCRRRRIGSDRELRVACRRVASAGSRTMCGSRYKAAGVSFVDGLVAAGRYQVKPPVPFTPGSECAGIVTAIGSEVAEISPGQKVIATGWHGMFAEVVTLPAKALWTMPDNLSFAEAAVLTVSYATVWHGLVDRGRLQPGETLLVLGAGGATGYAAVQVGCLSWRARRCLRIERGQACDGARRRRPCSRRLELLALA